MTPQEAELRLFKLGVEDCSTYVVDPRTPSLGTCAYDCAPALSADELRQYLGAIKSVPGVGMARRVGEWVYDGSASEMETLLWAGLALSPHLGGLGLDAPLANFELPLSDLQRLALNHVDHLTPDLLWLLLRIILEYLGDEPHEGKSAQDEDMGRIQDYQVLGYLVFPVRFKHVRNPAAFNRLAQRLAAAMEERGARGVRAWLDELLSDEDFLHRQRVLFKVMLPAVHDR